MVLPGSVHGLVTPNTTEDEQSSSSSSFSSDQEDDIIAVKVEFNRNRRKRRRSSSSVLPTSGPFSSSSSPKKLKAKVKANKVESSTIGAQEPKPRGEIRPTTFGVLIDHPPPLPPSLPPVARVLNPEFEPAVRTGAFVLPASVVVTTTRDHTPVQQDAAPPKPKRSRLQALLPCQVGLVARRLAIETAAASDSSDLEVLRQLNRHNKKKKRGRPRLRPLDEHEQLVEYWSPFDPDDPDNAPDQLRPLSYEEHFRPDDVPIARLRRSVRNLPDPIVDKPWDHVGIDVGAYGAADKGNASVLWAVPDYTDRPAALYSVSGTSTRLRRLSQGGILSSEGIYGDLAGNDDDEEYQQDSRNSSSRSSTVSS